MIGRWLMTAKSNGILGVALVRSIFSPLRRHGRRWHTNSKRYKCCWQIKYKLQQIPLAKNTPYVSIGIDRTLIENKKSMGIFCCGLNTGHFLSLIEHGRSRQTNATRYQCCWQVKYQLQQIPMPEYGPPIIFPSDRTLVEDNKVAEYSRCDLVKGYFLSAIMAWPELTYQCQIISMLFGNNIQMATHTKAKLCHISDGVT